MASEEIFLQRAIAVVEADRISIYPARVQVIGALIEIGLAGLAVLGIVLGFDSLPVWVLMPLLLVALLLGPIGVLGLIFGVIGTAFVMDRQARTARWQQGFLGMGIGTTDGTGFARIAGVEVTSDGDDALRSGEHQDVITWDVEIVKDDGVRMPVGTVITSRPMAMDGATRANRLAEVLGEMAGVEVTLAMVPDDDDSYYEDDELEDEPASEGARDDR
ncbi:MAG: hypothetical protein DWI48_01645 [Chloroflexi bacterium]|nr:MAG: hypothetical protein DWI48_01645 [Chloroflexota bacterium]